MDPIGVLFPFRFWVRLKIPDVCTVCDTKHKVLFLALRILYLFEDEFQICCVYVCPKCVKADPTNHIPVTEQSVLDVVKKHLATIKKAWGKGMENAIDLNKNTMLADMGKARKAGCDHCKKPAKLRCSNCHLMRYCSRECNEAQWNVHRKQCKNIAENSLLLEKIILYH